MINTFDRTVYSLCLEIDELKEEVKFWREKYKNEKKAYDKILNENLQHEKQGVSDALLFALSVQDDKNGNLVIKKEDRQSLKEAWLKEGK